MRMGSLHSIHLAKQTLVQPQGFMCVSRSGNQWHHDELRFTDRRRKAMMVARFTD